MKTTSRQAKEIQQEAPPVLPSASGEESESPGPAPSNPHPLLDIKLSLSRETALCGLAALCAAMTHEDNISDWPDCARLGQNLAQSLFMCCETDSQEETVILRMTAERVFLFIRDLFNAMVSLADAGDDNSRIGLAYCTEHLIRATLAEDSGQEQ